MNRVGMRRWIRRAVAVTATLIVGGIGYAGAGAVASAAEARTYTVHLSGTVRIHELDPADADDGGATCDFTLDGTVTVRKIDTLTYLTWASPGDCDGVVANATLEATPRRNGVVETSLWVAANTKSCCDWNPGQVIDPATWFAWGDWSPDPRAISPGTAVSAYLDRTDPDYQRSEWWVSVSVI